MADFPILYSAAMINAMLDDRKTQTRRLTQVKIEPQDNGLVHVHNTHGGMLAVPPDDVGLVAADYVAHQPGDRLWVRENFRTYISLDHVKAGALWSPGCGRGAAIYYEAGGNMAITIEAPHTRTYGPRDVPMHPGAGKLRPCIHMPRWASRITQHVTEVRVQRLQDISEADCLAEGCPVDPYYHDTTADHSSPPMVLISPGHWMPPRAWYHWLMDLLHGAGFWDSNPWMTVTSFEVEKINIEDARP